MTPDISGSTQTGGYVRAGRYIPPVTVPVNGTVLGDATIDEQYVHTPVGRLRRDQTQWTVAETVPGPERVPQWAIACAILLFFCMGPFSLLFLLAKEHVGETTTVHLTDGRVRYAMKVNTVGEEEYQLILRTIEWCERALPERRAIEG